MKNLKGFTLVELVITIAIVIILSVISVPIYRGYVDKSKMAEGYSLLGIILSAEKAYYSEYGTFLHDEATSTGNGKISSTEWVLGIDARGNKYFTSFIVGSAYDGIPYKFLAIAYPAEEIKDCAGLALTYDVTSGATFSS